MMKEISLIRRVANLIRMKLVIFKIIPLTTFTIVMIGTVEATLTIITVIETNI
jgi:hypothetical protein